MFSRKVDGKERYPSWFDFWIEALLIGVAIDAFLVLEEKLSGKPLLSHVAMNAQPFNHSKHMFTLKMKTLLALF